MHCQFKNKMTSIVNKGIIDKQEEALDQTLSKEQMLVSTARPLAAETVRDGSKKPGRSILKKSSNFSHFPSQFKSTIKSVTFDES